MPREYKRALAEQAKRDARLATAGEPTVVDGRRGDSSAEDESRVDKSSLSRHSWRRDSVVHG